jgi:protein gp37
LTEIPLKKKLISVEPVLTTIRSSGMSEEKWIIVARVGMCGFVFLNEENRFVEDISNAMEFDTRVEAIERRSLIGWGSFVDMHPRSRYE